jgi:hypothetical protein
MAPSSAPHTSDINALVRELFVPHASGQGGTHKKDEVETALTDALTETVRRTLSQATPLERVVFVESLAPALAEALAPVLAEALAPALAVALGDVIAQSKTGAAGKSSPTGKAAQDQGGGGAEHERKVQ